MIPSTVVSFSYRDGVVSEEDIAVICKREKNKRERERFMIKIRSYSL